MRGVRLFFILFCLGYTVMSNGQDCRPQNDSMVLVDFFGATKGVNWKNKWNMKKKMKEWPGISVNQAGCVTSILLPNNGLQGNIPDLDLPFLEKLDVSNNNILSILPDFSKVKSLRHLNISGNRFYGKLPALKNSPHLEVLIADQNQLDGQIPNYNHMTELQILDLSRNKLTGNLNGIGNLELVQDLNLSENNLSGGITLLKGYNFLIHLNLSNNHFEGPIPDLNGKSGLIDVDLSKNNLSGNLPDIDGLTQLVDFNLSENRLAGQFRWPVNVPELQDLRLSNNRLSDTIPDTGPVGKLVKFYAGDNMFTGKIPQLNLPELKELELSQNRLTGSVPEFDGLPKLQQFSLRLNDLDNLDFTPEWLDKIGFADVSENRLTFQDVVPFRNYRGRTIELFPQKNVHFAFDSFTVTKGNNYKIELDTDEDHYNTSYIWYKDGELISGNTKRNLSISNSIPRDAGNYTVVMINSLFPGFRILSDTFTLIIDCPEVIEERKIYLCPGEVFTYKNIVYSRDTMFADTVVSQNDYDCDSLYLFDIELYQPDQVHATDELCEGEIYYFGPDSIRLTQTGSYLDTFPNIGGCDSIVMLDLTFRPTYRVVKDVGICPGDSFFYADSVYYQDIDLVDTFTSAYGCDSIVTMEVRFSDPVRTRTQFDLCDGDSVWIDGEYYSSSVSWTDTLSAKGGCDSIATVVVTVHDSYEETINVRLCSPETFEWQGRQLGLSGVYSDTLRSSYGCDSILHLNLTVSPSYFSRDTLLICQGDSVYFNHSWLTGPGIYFSDKTTAMGCDSLVVLEIQLREYAEESFFYELCIGDTLTLNGKKYTLPGMFTDTFYSEKSCDTLVSIEIAITELILADSTIVGAGSTDSTGSISVEVSGGHPPYRYEWSTGDTTEFIDSVAAGMYTLVVTDSLGCMSTFSLIVPVMTFSRQSLEKKSWIRVRPNFLDRGSRSSIYLDVQEGMRSSRISLFNEMGQEMSHKKFDVIEAGQSLLWELGSYPAGVYYFHIREDGQQAFQVEKLVVF